MNTPAIVKDSPIFRELTGKYFVMGFFNKYKSFPLSPLALMLNFCRNSATICNNHFSIVAHQEVQDKHNKL